MRGDRGRRGRPSAADPRCASDGLDRLTCDLGAPVPVVIDLGAGDDLLASFIDPADALTARGGPGADRLLGGAGDDGLTGGPGTDSFAGDGTDLFCAGNDQVANESPNACETIERATGGGAGFAAIGRAAARRRSVRVRVSCPAACAGRLTLRTAGKVRLRGKRRIATLGRATFVLPAGGRRAVSVRLTRTGRRLVRRSRTLKVEATAVSSTAPRRTAVRRLTLRRPG